MSKTNMGFNNNKYIKLQSAAIDERIAMFGGKLYLEFGGKLFDDNHASRVLPGFEPNVKIEILKKLSDKLEVLFVISAKDIEKNKMRSDLGIAYEMDVLRQIDKLTAMGITANKIVITLFEGEPAALVFKNRIERRGLKAYVHTYTKGYPTDISTIVSDEGYGANSYIKTEKPIVVVTAPGAKSGKLATCLSQIYHEHKRGVKAGYAKYEVFPVWNLPIKHPINIAYEASTANIGDVNMIDNFHLEKYGKTAVNYNRDLAVFPILKNILHQITGRDIYYSPTDMGVNLVGKCIENDAAVCRASENEIIRRYLNSLCDYKNGLCDIDVPNRIKVLMDELGIGVDDRKVALVAAETKEVKKSNIVAIGLSRGRVVTGKDTDIMTAAAAAVINTIKQLSKIEDKIHLISPVKLNPILQLKQEIYGETRLNLPDALIALAESAATNPTVELALSNLPGLRGLEAHSTVMLPKTEIDSLKKLGLNITCTDEFASI